METTDKPVASTTGGGVSEPHENPVTTNATQEDHLSDFSDVSSQHNDNERVLAKRKTREGEEVKGQEITSHLESEELLPHLDDDLSYEKDLRDTKFIMKNGCCRECMKAFSKTGKVSTLPIHLSRAVCAKSQDCSGGPHSLRMGASTVGARAATRLTLDVTSGRRLRTS
jgi:hypothetical protein